MWRLRWLTRCGEAHAFRPHRSKLSVRTCLTLKIGSQGSIVLTGSKSLEGNCSFKVVHQSVNHLPVSGQHRERDRSRCDLATLTRSAVRCVVFDRTKPLTQ
ncbi:hypothetical protein ACVWXP_007513 [Bradyrhizobium sp. USDA 4463]